MAEAARRRGNPDAARTVAEDLLALAGLGEPERRSEAESGGSMGAEGAPRVKFGAGMPLGVS
jgi:hypothetical protein